MKVPPIWWGKQHQKHGFGALCFLLGFTLKKKKKKAELKLCMEYQAGVDDAPMRKLLLGWISAMKTMVVEEKLMAEICSEASAVEFEKSCKRKTKYGNQVTALWTKWHPLHTQLGVHFWKNPDFKCARWLPLFQILKCGEEIDSSALSAAS